MKRKTPNTDPRREIAQAAIDGLKDVIKDLEVFKDGRGTEARHWTVLDALWKVSRMVDELNPRKQRDDLEAATKPKTVKQIEHRPQAQPLFAIEDHT